MKNVLRPIAYIIILLCVLYIIKFIVNESFISNYNEGIYNQDQIAIEKYTNFIQPYIYYYNVGNVLYNNGDYDGAIEMYEKALKLLPPQKKECSIRINLALAKLAKIDEDNYDPEYIEEELEILRDAKDDLIEDGCAHRDDDNGHSETAEKLKEEIENREEMLENLKQSSEQGDDGKNGQSQTEEEKEQEENVKEQLLNEQQQSTSAHNEGVEESRDYMNYEYYSGKQW